MRCPECNGRGETIYFVETERDEYSITIEQRQGVCRTCNGSGEKPMTNADRIRAMNDEELAKILNAFTGYFNVCNRSIEDVNCEDCELYELCGLGEGKALNWLQQPAEGE